MSIDRVEAVRGQIREVLLELARIEDRIALGDIRRQDAPNLLAQVTEVRAELLPLLGLLNGLGAPATKEDCLSILRRIAAVRSCASLVGLSAPTSLSFTTGSFPSSSGKMCAGFRGFTNRDGSPFAVAIGGVDWSRDRCHDMQQRVIADVRNPQKIVLPQASIPIIAGFPSVSNIVTTRPLLVEPDLPRSDFVKVELNTGATSMSPSRERLQVNTVVRAPTPAVPQTVVDVTSGETTGVFGGRFKTKQVFSRGAGLLGQWWVIGNVVFFGVFIFCRRMDFQEVAKTFLK